MHSRLVEMTMYLDMGRLDDVRFVGICGMGGIGKTTIARFVYEELSSQFEGSSFLANVREVDEKQGLLVLQQQLLSEILMDTNIAFSDAHSGTNEIRDRLRHKRVLIILDDVIQLDQLKALAGMHDWFGSGSRIIITTRDEHLLKCHGVDKIYKVEGLSHDEALHLFCLKAFKNDYPPADDYSELANQFVTYCNGLPLAIDVIGSFLLNKSLNEWRSALERLKEIPNQEIQEKLYISYDGLEEIEKKIFLDIACFFNGEDKYYVMNILRSSGFYPDIGIRVLINKSLITISKERIWMHDLLQEMGRDIVRRESHGEPGKRSRLWHYSDIYHVLSKDMGTEQVEGIVLNSYGQEDEVLNAKAFAKMKRLRLLKLPNVKFSKELGYLSNNLRYLEWDKYPFKSFPSTFQPNHLVELNMQCSNMVQLWKGIKPLQMLKVIDLSYSVNLIKTMDFKEVPNLEKLNLEGCSKLSEVHHSIGILKGLFLLNLKDCKNLSSLPNTICDLKSLKFLDLFGCSSLEKLPDRLGEMTCLEKLNVGGVATRQLPLARVWDLLIPSRFFAWKNPTPMVAMLPSLFILRSLKSLDLSYCNLNDGALPNDMGCFPLLKTLNLSGNNFVSIPSSITRLTKLEDFRFAECKRLESFPNIPSSILYLSMEGCSALEALLPRSISKQFKLLSLHVEGCKRLRIMLDLSSTILKLSVEGLGLEESHSKLTFVNCFKLFEVESENTSAFSRMTGYLHYLLRHNSQGFFNPSSKISMCLARDEIPGWFNHQSPGSSLELHLPPHWWTNKWMGFAFCIVFELIEPETETCTMSCTLNASIGPDEDLFLGHSAVEIPKDTNLTSDQLWFNYMPRSSLTCLDMWNECKGIKVRFESDQVAVKNCGLRGIFSRDADELATCRRDYKNLVIPGSNGKRCRDEHWYECSAESSEGGDLIDGLPAKRVRMPVDPEINLTPRRPFKRI